jgi:hypothetical protein
MPEIAAPPKWIFFLLWPFKGESCYPQIEGDLSEEFQYRVSKDGMTAARRWYRREVCRNLWSLTWRWETIAVIVLPLICVALGVTFLHPARLILRPLVPLHSLLQPPSTPMYIIMYIMIILLQSTIIPGLAFPVVCSALLRGHDRMIRLVFTVYCLGLSAIWGMNHSDILISELRSRIGVLSPVIVFGLLGPVYILPFIWMGSIWIERRHSRQTNGLHHSA